MKTSKWEILSYIRQYISEKTPGYLHILDIVSREKTGKTATELLLEDPVKLYKILEEYYNDESIVLFIFSTIILKPLAIKLGNPALVDELLKAIIEGDKEKFFNILKKNGLEIKD